MQLFFLAFAVKTSHCPFFCAFSGLSNAVWKMNARTAETGYCFQLFTLKGRAETCLNSGSTFFAPALQKKMGSAAPQLYYGIVMTEIKNNREKCDVTLPW